MVRRDAEGLTHYASAPSSSRAHRFGMIGTFAFCDLGTVVTGTVEDVSQDGPTCLWCLVVYKRVP